MGLDALGTPRRPAAATAGPLTYRRLARRVRPTHRRADQQPDPAAAQHVNRLAISCRFDECHAMRIAPLLASASAHRVWAVRLAEPQPVAEDRSPSPQTIELTVAPAAEPRPALKYRLMPAPQRADAGQRGAVLLPGDAAPNKLPKDHWKEYDDKQRAWLAERPDKLFPRTKSASGCAAEPMRGRSSKTAAYREYCDWDSACRTCAGMETISFLLHEMQECRTLARMLQLRPACEMMDGRPDDALETLRLGYQLAHDVAQPPLLINGLVGIAIAGSHERRAATADRAQRRKLLLGAGRPARSRWSICGRRCEFEMNMPRRCFRSSRTPKRPTARPTSGGELMIECLRGLESLAGESSAEVSGWQAELAAAALVAKLYPRQGAS